MHARRITPLPITMPAAALALITLLALPAWLGAQAAKPAAKGAAAAPPRVTSTDPALRLKGFDQHQAMKQASPFKDLKWQFLGPKNISGRSIDIAVVAPRGKNYTIYVADRDRRPVEDRERSDHLAADVRAGADDDHRRRGDRAVEPGHRLDRHRRGEHLPQFAGRRRRLQVGGCRQDLAAHGAHRHLHDSPNRHPPDQPRRRVRRGVRPRVDEQRRARRLQDDRRRQDVGEGAVRQREDRRHRPRDGPGRPEHALRRHLAAHPPEVERPAQLPRLRRQRHPQVHRRRQDLGADQQGAARAEVPRAHRPRRLPLGAERGVRLRGQLRDLARADRGGEGRPVRPAVVRLHQGRDRLPLGRQGRDVDAGERPDARAEDVHGAPLEHLRLGVRPDPRGPDRREHGLHDGPRPERVVRRRQDVQAAADARRRSPRPVDRPATTRTTWSTSTTRGSRSRTTAARRGRTRA